MIILKNRGFKRKYVYGGSGVFDSIAGFFAKLFSKAASNAVVRQAASTVLDAGKSVAKEVGKKAVDAGKEAAISAGKNLIEKGVNRFLTPKSQEVINKLTDVAPKEAVSIANFVSTSKPEDVSKRAQEILSKYINDGASNINKLIDGSGCKTSKNAIAIRDLVRTLNGAGLKAV